MNPGIRVPLEIYSKASQMSLKGFYQYIGQSQDVSKAEAFWNWFTANQNSYLFFYEVDVREKDRLQHAFSRELHRYNPELSFEIAGNPKDDKLELRICPDKDSGQYPAAQLLIEFAPEYRNWKVVSIKFPSH